MFKKLLSLLVILAMHALAQVLDADARIEQLTSLPIAAADPEYRLGPGDLLEIEVLGVEQLTQLVRVNAGGMVTLPILGPVSAGELSAIELENQIAYLLKDRQLLLNPQVTVFIKEYRSQPIYVLGAVTQPGQYMASGQLRLLDALSMAGGLDAKRAGDQLFIDRKATDDTEQPDSSDFAERDASERSGRVEINLRALLEGGDLSLNRVLQAGDVVQVPERPSEQFYVVGDVQHPGAFAFGAQRNLTVITAMSFAGGFGRTAKPEKARILRVVPGKDVRASIEVNLKEILLGKDEDLKLRPEDVLVVPTSGAKSFKAYVLPAAVAAGIGSLVWAGFTH